MYIPKGVPCSLVMLVCRCPLLVVPLILGLAFGLPHPGVISQPVVPEAMITFAFDDGYLSAYNTAFPILERYSYQGTVFAITANINQPGYITANQLQELANKGWEIGSHTVSHPYLTQLSDAQILSEIRDSKLFLEGLGLSACSLSSPYGDYDQRVLAMAGDYYLAHLASWPAALNDIPLNNYQNEICCLSAVAVEAKTTVQEVIDWITQAKEQHKWLILLFHRLDECGDYNWPSQDLETVVRFAYEQGFQGQSLSQQVP
ncbi:polysaccharide deacetylase family protein [Patescibacteria group bacterium]|nr:polysaccharide deacetylase family protein [Patescibacteria group bacterium]